ncbi:MAG: amidohydrolase family protein, partial [Thermoanaerobaculia bacterium]
MTIVRSRNVVTPGGTRAASIHIRDGRIERVADFDDVPAGAGIIDYGDLTVMAGLVDSHVHINEPGRTEWEGFDSATRAAAAGGVTTIVDMPLNSLPPTTSVASLMTKAEAMEGKCRVDVGLWGGAVPGNAASLPSMLKAGALGFKCFLIDSGVPEFGHLDAAGLRQALESLRDQGSRLLVHAELPGPIAEAAAHLHGDVRTYARYLASRPPSAEDQAIELLIHECDRTRSPAHVVHLSSSGSL